VTGLPFLSVVVPCWNEARFIAAFLDSLLLNDYPPDRMEILLVDGMSDDGTRDVVRRYAGRDPRLRMIDNPGHSKPVALNRGIRQSRGDVVIRLDVHAVYPHDYLSKCVRALLANPEADNVGGLRRSLPRDENLIGRALSLSTTDAVGAGNAKYRVGASAPQWVDTVFGGCYRREVFDWVGLFDEKLTRAQDREFNQRLCAAGGRILLLPDIECTYYTRSDWRQFGGWIFEGSYWPFRASRLVGRWIGGWRNVVPMGFVLGLAAGAALSPRWAPARRLTGAVLTLYGGTLLTASARLAWRRRDPGLLAAMPIAFAATHLIYGVGSIWGIVDPRPATYVPDDDAAGSRPVERRARDDAGPEVRIVTPPLSNRQIAAVARMHRTGVSEGFLSSLGEPVLRLLYRHLAGSRHCAIFVALAPDGTPVGYICGSRDTSALYREFLRRRWPAALRVMVPRLLSPGRIRRAVETLRYPAAAEATLPKAEIVNLVVEPGRRGAGLADLLLDRLMRWFAEQGETAVKAVSGEQLGRAHRFYEKSGARLHGTTTLHRGVGSRVYVYSIGQDS
jgi:succinoglycan biosynthesis protein ExoA